MRHQAVLSEPRLRQTLCPRDLFPLSLDMTIAPVNMVKASTRQKAEGQLPEGFDKTERVFIPDCYKASGFQVVHKRKICTKYLSLSKKKPANVWTQSIFNVTYRNFSKTVWGIVSEKGKTFQTACFQNPSEPCEGDGQMFCWSPSHCRAHAIIRERADLELRCLSPIPPGADGLQREGPAGQARRWAVQLPWSGVSSALRNPQFGLQPLVPARERSCSLSRSYSPLNKASQEREGIISFLKGQLTPL